jgi:hypothetical protein
MFVDHHQTVAALGLQTFFTADALALQLQSAFEVSPSRHGLMASSPDGPSDDEGGLDPVLG